MKSTTEESIARGCLIAYSVLLVLSALLLSVAGDRVEWYATIALALVPPILMGNRKQRIIASIFVILTLVLVMADHRAGMERLRSRTDYRSQQNDGGVKATKYRHSEQAAMHALMNTAFVRALCTPGRRLTCRIDYVEGETIYVYLGDWGPYFDCRIGCFKVLPDGSVWRNTDPTYLEDSWIEIR
jgi:hypothetical protein